MSFFEINGRRVGEGSPALIVAEIGNNHNGNFQMAVDLIKKAAESKADAVKFQIKKIDEAFPADLLNSPYTGHNSFGSTYREHKEALELSHEEYSDLKALCDKMGILFFATPFDVSSVKFLESLNVQAYKIASFHVTNCSLIEAVCESEKPIILSTGMSTLEEIDQAVAVLRESKSPFALLQCTSSYPTDDEDVNLVVIEEFRRRYNCVVGYSGHDRGITIAAASVCFGSKIIEKHFTLDRTLKGPDHAASLEPKGLAGLVERTRLIEKAIGTPLKQILPCELKNRKKFRGY